LRTTTRRAPCRRLRTFRCGETFARVDGLLGCLMPKFMLLLELIFKLIFQVWFFQSLDSREVIQYVWMFKRFNMTGCERLQRLELILKALDCPSSFPDRLKVERDTYVDPFPKFKKCYFEVLLIWCSE
jgi:hypothetical protein